MLPLSPRRRRHRQARALRGAIEALPASTRQAMLGAVQSDEVIVGAYTDHAGRVCPMLAAHRRGARTDVGGFARAWDAFAGARRPRPATGRELQILAALLQESLGGHRPAARADGPVAPAAADRPPAAPTPA